MAELLGELPDGAKCEHLVQVYRDAHELAEAVAVFLCSGFERGEPAVVIATAAHWPPFADRLAARGWPVARVEEEGLLTLRDADETLAAICDDGVLSRRRFAELVGGLIDSVAASKPRRRVRAFGEMVDLLCRRDDAAAADELEGLWNELAERRNFTLLCGYKIDVFDREAQVRLLPQVYRTHTHVMTTADGDRIAAAVRSALTQVLGEADAEKVYARVSSRPRDAHVPLPQLALMWVSAHMPRTAEDVLAAARASYITAV